jgi:hypothetical protein
MNPSIEIIGFAIIAVIRFAILPAGFGCPTE